MNCCGCEILLTALHEYFRIIEKVSELIILLVFLPWNWRQVGRTKIVDRWLVVTVTARVNISCEKLQSKLFCSLGIDITGINKNPNDTKHTVHILHFNEQGSCILLRFILYYLPWVYFWPDTQYVRWHVRQECFAQKYLCKNILGKISNIS